MNGGGGGANSRVGGIISNPFYVMRSARKAFEGCKYLLSCLREDDICPVNVATTNRHIHHYRGQEVSWNLPPKPNISEQASRQEFLHFPRCCWLICSTFSSFS
jgi:hypothetical protein